MKTAVALDAAEPVLAHFGRAGRFWIYEDVEGVFRLVESRPSSPPCGGDHADEQMNAAAHLISDCAVVIAARFGPCAIRETGRAGIYPFEMEGTVDDGMPETLARLSARLFPGRSKQKGRKVS